jgi:NOL1/NOP2/sun family putative RNA methylase
MRSLGKPVIPDNFKARYEKILGKENELFLKYCEKELRKSIRINTLKADPAKVLRSLKEKNWKLKKIPWSENAYWVGKVEGGGIGNSLEHFLGWIYSQEASSMVPPVVLNPQKDDFILDMCAAPGSKTTQLAQIMENQGCIVANDDDYFRIKALRFNLSTCGVMNTVVTNMNGLKFGGLKERFDKVLIDVPCSSEGIVRKNWNVLSRWGLNLPKRMSIIQKKLISAGIEALKKYGVLVYSTCTLAPEENEAVIDFALKNFSNLAVEDVVVKGLKSRSGILKWEGQKYSKEIEKTIRIWPQDNDTEGFFVARLRKT